MKLYVYIVNSKTGNSNEISFFFLDKHYSSTRKTNKNNLQRTIHK